MFVLGFIYGYRSPARKKVRATDRLTPQFMRELSFDCGAYAGASGYRIVLASGAAWSRLINLFVVQSGVFILTLTRSLYVTEDILKILFKCGVMREMGKFFKKGSVVGF